MTLDTTIGGASADSYGTLADFQTYAANMGWTLTGTDVEQDADNRRATLYLDRNYNWRGLKATDAQARRFPTIMSELVDGYSVPSDTTPQDIIDAQFELAFISNGGTDLFATVETGAVSESSVKVDVIEESFKYKSPREHPLFTSISGLIYQYHKGSKLSGAFGSVDLVR